MKRLFAFLGIVLVLLLLAVVTHAGEVQGEIGTVTVTSDGSVNIRSKGNTDSPVVLTARPGERFVCTGMAESGWYEILTDGKARYIAPGKVVFYPLRGMELDIDEINERIVIDPGDALAYQDRGNYHSLRGLYESAYEDFTQAIALDGSAAQYAGRAAALYAMERTEAAKEDAQKAIAADKAYTPGYYWLGLCLLREEKPEEALEQFLAAIPYGPEEAAIYNEIGVAYRQKWEKQEAIKWFGEAISRSGGDKSGVIASYYYNRAEIFAWEDEYDKAVADLKIAVGLQEDFIDAYFLMAISYDIMGNYREAWRCIDKAALYLPEDILEEELAE